MTPLEELSQIVDALPPEEAIKSMLMYIFRSCAETEAALEAHTKVLGAIAGRVGINGDALRKLVDP